MKTIKTYMYLFIIATALLFIITGFRVVYVVGPNTDQTKFQSIKKNDSDLPGLKIFTFQALTFVFFIVLQKFNFFPLENFAVL